MLAPGQYTMSHNAHGGFNADVLSLAGSMNWSFEMVITEAAVPVADVSWHGVKSEFK